MDQTAAPTLSRTLGGFHLWGIAVGLVISGEYFGWSYGWAQAGTLGFLITTVVVAVMYVAFIFSFTELTTAMPQAGGPFAYSLRAFGPAGGAIAGFATLIEFLFAPPAIALAIGAYLAVQFPALDPKIAATAAYLVFVVLNIIGVQIAATFELVVTLLAVAELLIFIAVVLPDFIVGDRLRAGELVTVLDAFAHSAGAAYVVHPAHRQRSATVRAFTDYLVEHFVRNIS